MKWLIAYLLFFISCQSPTPPQKGHQVLVTIPPYAFFVEKIAGTTVDIKILVPPGMNPHIYEPMPSQAVDAVASQLWIRIDEPFEQKLLPLLKDKMSVVNLIDATPLASDHHHCCNLHHHDQLDRHIWLSPKLGAIQAKCIAEALSETFPEHRDLYRNNLTLFLSELEQIDLEITKALTPFQGDTLLASHAAFGYFCTDYHLSQMAIETEGKDPLPKEIEQLLLNAKTSRVRSVLSSPQYSDKGALLIAKELNLPLHSIDPYEKDIFQTLTNLSLAITHDRN